MSSGRYSPDYERRSPGRRSSAGGKGYDGDSTYRRRTPPIREKNGGSRGRSSPATTAAQEEAFSNYYHDRFGSQSPEEYKNLRISHIDPHLSNDELREILEKEFRRYGDFHVKIIRGTGGPEERLAYINFQRPESARKSRKASTPRMQELLGKYVRVDPAGVIRDQEGRLVAKDQLMQQAPRGYPPPQYRPLPTRGYPPQRGDQYSHRGRPDYASRGMEQRGGYDRGRPRSPGMGIKRHAGDIRRGEVDNRNPRDMDIDEWKLMEHMEQGATRTLFLGNLPFDIREKDLKHIFERYGYVQDIDIKTPRDANAAYAFICYENMDQAQEAKYHEQDALIGGMRCNIGYGKPSPTRRLFVGGLGPWSSLNILEAEFDRYGAIEKIEYEKSDNHAYITFSTLEAASQACRAMMGFPLGGRERCIRVDYCYDISAPDTKTERNKAYRAVLDSRERGRKRSYSRSSASRSNSASSSDSRRSSEPKKRKKGPRTPPTTPPPASPPKRRGKSISPASDEDFVPRLKKEKQQQSLANMSAVNLGELEKMMDPCWTGALVLKKSAYAIRLYRLKGEYDMIEEMLKDAITHESHKLHVTQRLPFSQSKPADFERYLTHTEDTVSFLLVSPNPNVATSDLKLAENPTRPLKTLVHYLNEKQAAGVITVPTQSAAVLYMFPKCPIAEGILRKLCPGMHVLKANSEDCLLAILVKQTAAK